MSGSGDKEWLRLDIGEREQRAFEEIMPAGRSLDVLHLNTETGMLRITLDNGAEINVPSRKQ